MQQDKPREIMIVAQGSDYFNDHICQIISKAFEISSGKDKVSAAVLNPSSEKGFEVLLKYGAHMILTQKLEGEDDFRRNTDLAERIIRERKPEVILFPADDNGKKMAAILSARLSVGLTADCTDLMRDESGNMIFQRSAMGESVIAKIKGINSFSSMGTVKKDVFRKIPVNLNQKTNPVNMNTDNFMESISCSSEEMTDFIESLTGEADKEEIIRYSFSDIKMYPERIKVISSEIYEEDDTVDLNAYSTVFCVGRGIKNIKTLETIRKVADKAGAVVVGTRAVTDEGMIEKKYQVGQSGKAVSPKIYLSFGVSGASQHIVGIKNSETIISVNTDREAPIHRYSDYSVIEDLNLILDEMKKELNICE